LTKPGFFYRILQELDIIGPNFKKKENGAEAGSRGRRRHDRGRALPEERWAIEEQLMKKLMIALICGLVVLPAAAWGQKWIEPYTDKDGTQVEGHWQIPEDQRQDRYSTPGRVNPYTGQFNPYTGSEKRPQSVSPAPATPMNPNPYFPQPNYRYPGALPTTPTPTNPNPYYQPPDYRYHGQ
jgi:hypothetical protein